MSNELSFCLWVIAGLWGYSRICVRVQCKDEADEISRLASERINNESEN